MRLRDVVLLTLAGQSTALLPLGELTRSLSRRSRARRSARWSRRRRCAALVFAVSNVAGLLSLIPGGLGAYEGSVIGLLIGFGVNPGAAPAIAIIQRLASQGIATGAGFASYAVARRTLGVSGLGTTMAVRPSAQDGGAPRPGGQPATAGTDETRCSWRSAA